MFSGKTIFISPLDWGLGHATRCVPIIHSLSKANKIILGVTPLNAFFFNRHFPELQKIELPSYKISYSKRIPLWLKLVLQWPQVTSIIRQEKKLLETIIKDYTIDVVISDNRFGLTCKNVHCIFITHQLNLKTPFFSFLVNTINRNYIHRFDEVWVPDYEDKNRRLSGQLSDSGQIKIPVNYIGPKSALADLKPDDLKPEPFEYLILLSGVEPQRSSLENIVMKKFGATQKKIILVRGSNSKLSIQNKNIKAVDFAFGKELRALIVNAGTVICRSGYSTLMDLHLLDKKELILIPTPGQTEQEYLASFWNEKFNSKTVRQENIHDFTFE